MVDGPIEKMFGLVWLFGLVSAQGLEEVNN